MSESYCSSTGHQEVEFLTCFAEYHLSHICLQRSLAILYMNLWFYLWDLDMKFLPGGLCIEALAVSWWAQLLKGDWIMRALS